MISFVFLVSLLLLTAWRSATQAAVPFPALPHVFSATVEANIINKNKTLLIEEAFDERQGVSFRVVSEGDERMHSVELYKLNQEWVWHQRLLDGTVSRCKLFPQGRPERVPSMKEFMQIGNTTREEYNGTAQVRGIPCDVWVKKSIVYHFPLLIATGAGGQKLTVTTRTVFDSVWYFARPTWTFNVPYHTRIPVRAVVRGTHKTTSNDPTVVPNKEYSFHHSYEFIKYEEPSSIDVDAVQAPISSNWRHACDTKGYCSNPAMASSPLCKEKVGPLMPRVSDVYSATIERIDTTTNTTILIDEVYDRPRGLVFLRRGDSFMYLNAPADELWLWDSSTCELRPARTTNFLEPRNEMMFGNESIVLLAYLSNWTRNGSVTYQGRSSVREIEADEWEIEKKQWNGTFKYFFAARGWTNGFGVKRAPLLRVDDIHDMLGRKKIIVNNILKFVPNSKDLTSHVETALGSWRGEGCDVREFCVVHPDANECGSSGTKQDGVHTNKRPLSVASVAVITGLVSVVVTSVCVSILWYVCTKRGTFYLNVNDNDEPDAGQDDTDATD